MYASLIGFDPLRLKVPKGDELPRKGSVKIFFLISVAVADDDYDDDDDDNGDIDVDIVDMIQ